jgi:PAS domain S-box-containing protein
MRTAPRDAETHADDPFAARAHASRPERRVDAWRSLHDTFVREAKEAGTAGRPRCRTLFLGDSITEAMRGSQFGELYDELAARREAFESSFPLREARAFGVSGDRTQHLLWRVRNGELAFRHPPGVVVVCIGTNNLGRDNDSATDTFLGIRAVVLEILHRLPGTRVLLTGILPRGPGLARGGEKKKSARRALLAPAPGESSLYSAPGGENDENNDFVSKYAQPGVHTFAIEEVNAKLRALASGSGGSVGYCDGSSAFLVVDEKNSSDVKKYKIHAPFMRDALHPTAEGMRVWFQTLVPAVEALRAAPAPLESWYEGSRALGDETDARNGSLRSVDEGVRLALSRLIAWSPHALCVCDVRETDAPIVFANDNFFTQTGYGAEEVLGRNCRFLQGKGTAPDTVAEMREKISNGEEFSGRVLNYHKNGVPLMNSLVMSPLRDSSGNVSHYIGIQRLATVQALRDAPAEYQHRAAL